jgi:hypothetical protein
MQKQQTIIKKTEKDEREIIRSWLTRDDPLIIVTHQKVDADAAFSAALLHVLKPNAAVLFVRADSEISQPEVIAVDLLNGSSAVKGLGEGSAFGMVVSVLKNLNASFAKALKPWAQQLNLTDQAKHCRDRVILADLVTSWRSIGLDDTQIVKRAEELLQGKMNAVLRHQLQQKHAKELPIEGKVAVLGPRDYVCSKNMFQRGALAVVRQGKNGMAVNLSKKAISQGMSLNSIKDEFPAGWFVHPDGFLACFGGPKAPKDPKEAGISLQNLEVLIRALVKGNEVDEENGMVVK